jgi:hypothetical protein
LFCLLTERVLGVVLSVDLACPWGRFISCWLPNFSRQIFERERQSESQVDLLMTS